MSDYVGHLRKMGVTLRSKAEAMQITEASDLFDSDNTVATNVDYELLLDDRRVSLNQCIGKKITLESLGKIECVHCGRASNKSFNQGYCYPCFKSLARCDQCIVSPEKCHFDQGTCREPDWASQFCMQDHFVYLANSSGIKVGITRGTQIPTRWVDQGAVAALPFFRVATRQQAGLLEMICKQHVADKTNWRAMLKGAPDTIDLQQAADELLVEAGTEIDALTNQFGLQSIQHCVDAGLANIHYPVLRYPEKVSSFNFDKTPLVEGVLWGIKGQYLILDTGVINVRKFGGYKISFSYED